MSTLTLDRRSLLKVTATAGALAATATALNLDVASANTSTARTSAAAAKTIDSYHSTKKLNLGSKVGSVQTISYRPYPNRTVIVGYLQNYTGGYIFAEHPDHTYQFSNGRRKVAGIGFVRKGSGIDALIKNHNAKNPNEKLYPVSAEYTVESRVIGQELRVAQGLHYDTTDRARYAYANWFKNTGNGLLITDDVSARTILSERNTADPLNAQRPMTHSSLIPDMRFFQSRSPWIQKDEFTTLGAAHIANTMTSGIDNTQFHVLQASRNTGLQPVGYLRIGGLFSRTVCATLKNTRTYRAVDFDADLSRNLRYHGSKTSYFGYFGIPVGANRGRDGNWNSKAFIGLIWVEETSRMFTISDIALFKELRRHGERPIQAEIKNADGSISIYTTNGTYTSKNGVVTFASI